MVYLWTQQITVISDFGNMTIMQQTLQKFHH